MFRAKNLYVTRMVFDGSASTVAHRTVESSCNRPTLPGVRAICVSSEAREIFSTGGRMCSPSIHSGRTVPKWRHHGLRLSRQQVYRPNA